MIDKQILESEEINFIRKSFANQKVKIVKYNDPLDETTNKFCYFEGFMQLDGTEIVITNKKPLENPQYILEADKKVVK